MGLVFLAPMAALSNQKKKKIGLKLQPGRRRPSLPPPPPMALAAGAVEALEVVPAVAVALPIAAEVLVREAQVSDVVAVVATTAMPPDAVVVS